MDVLSDALNVVRLAGAVFFTATFSSPWAIASPPREDLARFLRLPSQCLALFHIVSTGQCVITLDDMHSMTLQAGDVAILPHGSAHEMGSERGVTPLAFSAILPALPSDTIPQITVGRGNKTAQFVCGYLHCAQQFNPLLEALPRLLVIRTHPQADDGLHETNVIYVQTGEWLDMTLRYIIQETERERQGHAVMLARLTEVLFVEIVRRYMQQLPTAQRGWLAGVRDPIIGQALRLLHAHPEHNWTVDELAQEVALSRSTFAQRFGALMGESPIHYLAGWRMQVAQHLLQQTNVSIAEIAERVGYDSEAAFSRAFKRYCGQPPALWRLAG